MINRCGRFGTLRGLDFCFTHCSSFLTFWFCYSMYVELWNPSWGIESVLVGLQSFMQEECPEAVGSITSSDAKRRKQQECPHPRLRQCRPHGANTQGFQTMATTDFSTTQASVEVVPFEWRFVKSHWPATSTGQRHPTRLHQRL